jgi:SNF2 family DNA or RNA helicase
LQGQGTRLVPHSPTETFILRKLGYDVPSPILTHYNWAGGTPFHVQKQTCALLTLNNRAYVLNDMGTGKTKASLWAFDYLKSNRITKRMLVAAPLSTLNFTWTSEIFKTVPHLKSTVLHGDKKRRLDRLADLNNDIFIINHDGIKVIHDELVAMIKAGEIDVLLIDELAKFRNGGSDRTKAMRGLARQARWVWGMTGSPMPREPTDVWGQASIVTPNTVPGRFTHFRDDLMLRSQHSQFKWFPKSDAVEKAYAVMQPAVRFALDEVVELPELIERTIDIDLSAKQEKVYKSLMATAHAGVASHVITGVNAGAVLMKLRQVACGWVYDSNGSVAHLDGDNRLNALIDCIDSARNKVLVAVPFKHTLAGISERLKKDGIDHAVVSGDVSESKRTEIFNAFQNTPRYKVLVAHPACMSHGITLTAADTLVWFAPMDDYEVYEQFNARIRRVGQKNKQHLLKFQATTVEKKLYKLLAAKQTVQDKFLELFELETERNPQR